MTMLRSDGRTNEKNPDAASPTQELQGVPTCLGWTSTGFDYTVLDPGGHVVPNRGSTSYRPPYSSGAFAGYYVLVTGRNSMGSPGKIGVKVM